MIWALASGLVCVSIFKAFTFIIAAFKEGKVKYDLLNEHFLLHGVVLETFPTTSYFSMSLISKKKQNFCFMIQVVVASS